MSCEQSFTFPKIEQPLERLQACIIRTSKFGHQMADIFLVPMQTAGKDRECEFGVHHCQCTLFGPIGFLHHINDLHTVWEHTVWEHTVWEHTVWEHTVWEHTVWEHTVWEHTVWEHTVWEHTVWEHTVWEHTVWEHIKYVDDFTMWEALSSSGIDSSLQIK